VKRLGLAMYVLAALSALGFAVNLAFGPRWIETLFEVEPDGGDGSFEAVLMFAPAVAALTFGALAYLSRHRAQPA
jgi:hypothetical protein